MFQSIARRVTSGNHAMKSRMVAANKHAVAHIRSFYTQEDKSRYDHEMARIVELAQKKHGVTGPTPLSPAQLAALRAKDSEIDSALNKVRAMEESKHYILHGSLPRQTTFTKAPVHVAVTGASGAIGYSLLFRIATGEMLGADQPVVLHLLELPQAMDKLQGVVMELQDCAFPLVQGIVATDNADKAFEGVQYAMLVGAKPRGPGMERGDLLKGNAKIFQVQGKALNDRADRENLRVLVVGNPANTNALIAAHNAKDIDPNRFTAMTKLDHNRGLAQLALKLGVSVNDISRFCIWGNHSATQYPDLNHTQVGDKWARDLIKDKSWIEKEFIPVVQQRGAAIIKARGASSAASAASSSVDHMREWAMEEGTKGEWTSMAVRSDGSYGATEGLYFSYPVVCDTGNYHIVQNVPIDEFSAQKIEASHKELLAERDAVREFL